MKFLTLKLTNYCFESAGWHDVLDAEGNFHDEEEGDVIRTFAFPQKKVFSSGALLVDLDSTENLGSHPSAIDLRESLVVDVPNIQEGEEAVIPSVCSISMATLNAMAAAAAAEHSVREENFGESHGSQMFGGSQTFGAHMKSPSMVGLDLEYGGLEF